MVGGGGGGAGDEVIVSSHCSLPVVQLSGGKVGHDELGVLSLCGSKAPVCEPPDIFHLPPIEEQRSSHASLLGRTSWPVTSGMLRSVT